MRQAWHLPLWIVLVAGGVAAFATQFAKAAPESTRAATTAPSRRAGPQASLPTHCGPTEHVVFSCAAEGADRVTSVCLGSADTTASTLAARYLDGPVRNPGVVLVQDLPPDVPVRFERTPLTFAGGSGGYALSAAQGDAVHIIYSISGEGQLARHGVMRTDINVERVLADAACRPDSVTESEDANVLREVRAWPLQPRLEKGGLPPTGP